MRAVTVIGGVVLAVGVAAIAASCTIFDGLTATETEGGPSSDSGASGVDSGVEAGPPELPGFLPLADGVAFCSNAFGCPLLADSVEYSVDVPVETTHFSACVDWVSGPLPANRVGHDDTAKYLKCAADAKTCSAAGGCFWYEEIDPSDPRCAAVDAGGPQGACEEDGGALYFCGGSSAIEHCNNAYWPAGFSCLHGDGGLYCAAPSCPAADTCSGGYLQYCAIDGLTGGLDCNIGGFTCGFDQAEGFDDCLTDGTAQRCSALSVACSGNSVALCDSSFVSMFDCASSGWTCDQTAFPRCKRTGETCTPLDKDIDICSGSTITMCVGGQHTTFDCASIGKTCVPAGGAQTAHCL